MAAPPRWDDDEQRWIYPEDDDYPGDGREQVPGAPPGYTQPSNPAPSASPETMTPSDRQPPTLGGNDPTPPTRTIGPWTMQFDEPGGIGLPELPPVPDAPKPNLPVFEKAAPFTFERFQAPSVEQALASPGYQFRLKQGEDALQRWAAAKGTLNDSSTGLAMLEHGQNAASQEYSNVWRRDFDAHNLGFNQSRDAYTTNYATQTIDPYRFAYQTAIDMWQPELATWAARNDRDALGYTTQTGATLAQNQMNYSNAWQQYLQQYGQWKDMRDFGLTLSMV